MTSDPVRVTNYLDAADTLSTLRAVQALGAIVERARRRAARSAAPACARRAQPTGAIDVGNAGTLLRLLPGWLAGQADGRVDRSTATSRSAAARSTASPSRCGGWARSSTRARAASRR